MKHDRIKTFYTPKQVLEHVATGDLSRSPQKPRLLMEYLAGQGLASYFEVVGDFPSFTDEDFRTAHAPEYVDAFFAGRQPLASSNELSWSREFADTVRYTNASLYQAIYTAIAQPQQVTFSPTSGFHHAQPGAGRGYCTFSGQVIASVKIYRELGIAGAYLDLDGHFGNSIEDSREFVPDLDQAVPRGCNLNPVGSHTEYVESFQSQLETLRKQIVLGHIGYVVFCHGADSHEADDLHGQCTTAEWLKCSHLFYNWVAEIEASTGVALPVTLSLFGGYRLDNYDAVLSLHTVDLVTCLNRLCGHDLRYECNAARTT
jgi:acetoin utilization deacetylase AcuC-like enzyme